MDSISQTGSGGGAQALGSPLDVQWIVEQLIYGKQQPIRDLETYQNFYEAKKTAFQDLNTKVSALESSLYDLNASGFDSKNTQLSTDEYFSASAGSTAEAGSYYIKVRQLATAESNSSTLTGVTDSDAYVLTDGETFSIEQNGETVDIDITGTTRTLSGLKNAINSSSLDVTATVVNDGTDYHLQVTANETGTDNALTITDTDVGTAMATKITAQNALINVNTEDVGDAISRGTNTITDVVEGITLNLLEADSNTTTTLSISNDTSNLKDTVQDFVEKFNDLKGFLNEQFEYNVTEGQSGILSGESSARKIQSDIMSMVSSRVAGLDSGEAYTGLFSIGIEITNDGSLEFNETDFNEALEDDPDAVKRIFKNIGTTSTNNDIQYVGKGDSTIAGRYEVIITKVAEKATVEGQSDVSTLASDETLTINYEGSDFDFSLTAGMDLNDVTSFINTEISEENLSFIASQNGDRLVITAESSGSRSLAVSSTGSGAGYGTEQTDTGVDVEGTIGGGAATGVGNVLTSTEGDPNGLMVYASASTTGNKGDIYLTFGIGEKLRQYAEDLSFPETGLIAKNIDGFDDRLENISDQIKDINLQLEKEQEILIDQFTRANQALVELQYLQSSLSNNLKT